MASLRRGVRAWPVGTYYALTLAISWGYWILLLAQGKRVVPGSTVSHFPGLLGPFLAALIVTALLDGKRGLWDLLSRMVRWRTAWPWGVIAALSPLFIVLFAFGLLNLFGTPFPDLDEFRSFPGLPPGMSLIEIILLVFVTNGYGEEVGWRGFALEKWLPKYGKFGATIRVAALWIFWHTPLFWLNRSMAALIGPMLVGWIIALVSGAFLMAYLYLVNGRSLFVVALWQAAYNMVVAPPGGAGAPAAVVSTVVMGWGLWIGFSWWKAGNNSEEERGGTKVRFDRSSPQAF